MANIDRNILWIVGIIISLVGIITLVLPWISFDLGWLGSYDHNAIDLATDGDFGGDFQRYLPLLIGILSLVSLLAYVGIRKSGKATFAVVLGIITVILAIVFYTWEGVSNIAGYAIYLAIVVGIVNVIVGYLLSK
ncbi:MAG: hypothetical protein LBM39_01700 [Candidatus Methanoplasma sp.]|nr:hypothetical protein [Candidatus Methanoplasma sp.]